jgi:hypothetical protein
MLTVIIGVILKLPMPVFAAASKNFTAVGAVAAAGTPRGYVIPFVGLVQVLPPVQATTGTALMFEAVVDSECVPVVNVVEVIVRFQPPPVPLGSVSVSPNV